MTKMKFQYKNLNNIQFQFFVVFLFCGYEALSVRDHFVSYVGRHARVLYVYRVSNSTLAHTTNNL